MIKKILNKLKTVKTPDADLDKHASETKFWKDEIDRYNQWYAGQLEEMYSTICPTEAEKVVVRDPAHSAILTWHKKHQEVKYLHDLNLDKSVFKGKKILDVGSGPIPSATCFEGADLYCLDPLLDQYLSVGFPLHYYGDVKFVHGYSEKIPVQDNFFDVVLSANALDHVDDFEVTASEIKRILKKDGVVIFHLHYHPPTQNEPLELNDERVLNAFSGIKNFRKLSESKDKFGYRCAEDESYALWSNII
jgi:SAM-dependent methyltransferase